MNPFRTIARMGALGAALLILSALTAAALVTPAKPIHAATSPPPGRLAYFPNLTHAAAIVGVERQTFARALGTMRSLP